MSMDQRRVDLSADPQAARCRQCGTEGIEAAYQANLCAPCRTALVNRPIPPSILVIAGVSLLLALVSCIRFPTALRYAIAEQRAKRAEERQDYAGAEHQLQIVTNA